jgi:glycosyltransferase involved in cell wall biosynthesis
LAVRSGKFGGQTLSNASSCAGVDVLFVQSNPSQLDNPFYSLLSNATGRIAVALLNSGASDRLAIDPELGLVPNFPSASLESPTYLLPSERESGVPATVHLVTRIRPKLVVVQDQTWRAKCQIALACRLRGVSVAMRSDKNEISSTARSGAGRALEGFAVRTIFDQLAPVSKLTANYYGWRDHRTCWWFPYPTLTEKFAPTGATPAVRARIRRELGVAAGAVVFLLVAKFVPRENPSAAVRAFAQAGKSSGDSVLIMVGAGRMESELRELSRTLGVAERTRFVGYVPYASLQDYFWASDVLVHLPICEPWGASAQDALVARMALIASDKVGAALCHLTGSLRRYVVSPDDVDAAGRLMTELATDSDGKSRFAPAWTAVDRRFTAESLAIWWAKRMESL